MQDRPWTVLSILDWGTEYFSQKRIRNHGLVSWLLSHILEVKRLDLYLLFDRPLHTDELNRLRPMVQRRAKYEPLQYITGKVDFLVLSLPLPLAFLFLDQKPKSSWSTSLTRIMMTL